MLFDRGSDLFVVSRTTTRARFDGRFYSAGRNCHAVPDRRILAVAIEQRPRGLSYPVGTGSVPLLGECVGEVLDHSAQANPEAPALVSCQQNRRFTYAQFRAAVGWFLLSYYPPPPAPPRPLPIAFRPLAKRRGKCQANGVTEDR